MAQKQKVLITGSLGFIYSNFIRKSVYDKKNYEIVSFDKATDLKLLNNVYYNRAIANSYLADVCDPHIVDRIFQLEKPEWCIHAAAESSVDCSLTNPGQSVLTNVVGTQNIINACLKHDVKLLLQSTDEVYGSLNDNEPAWTESSPLQPRNPYSASKASADLLVQAAGISHGLKYVIARSANNYGPRQSANKLIPTIIKSLLNKSPIPIYGNGLNCREWTHVEDNYSAIALLMEKGTLGEIYNISSNQELSNLELVNKICNIAGYGHDTIEFVKDRSGHDFRYSIDCSKIKALGWSPTVKLSDGLKNTVDWNFDNQYYLK